ncbi:GntR family transcriptional regulator [Mangrovibacter plantisponsor]|uniref:DNA-binding GntR family transcriptional regulator n=1 Tax=Mangrovibacter plantisponsor TaxID=451513 RepID=A0A317PYY0_9ENTR|nr:GntR family transcriptional regulator [Mangrovibacter plantisponsor]PWW04710.1 DNA-binding GntR family transcriptional regulator [Mangrovibacter plantisponsor]
MRLQDVGQPQQEQQDKEAEIWQSLMRAIVEHQLPPGCKLPEEALAEAFGVSRTGIRKVLTRLATVQMVTMTPRRGAFVASPGVEESKQIFRTRALLECANLPDVVAHIQPPHIAALENITQREEQAHREHDGAAAIRYSAEFHIQLHAISGNAVMVETLTRLTQRSSLVIAAWGAPWQQGCRCDDHGVLINALRQKDTDRLVLCMQQHFEDILHSLHFERSGETVPDFTRLFGIQEANR